MLCGVLLNFLTAYIKNGLTRGSALTQHPFLHYESFRSMDVVFFRRLSMLLFDILT